MDLPFISIPIVGTPIMDAPIIRTSIMGIVIEDVPIIDILTIGRHAHCGYIYNGYVQIAHCIHYGCV